MEPIWYSYAVCCSLFRDTRYFVKSFPTALTCSSGNLRWPVLARARLSLPLSLHAELQTMFLDNNMIFHRSPSATGRRFVSSRTSDALQTDIQQDSNYTYYLSVCHSLAPSGGLTGDCLLSGVGACQVRCGASPTDCADQDRVPLQIHRRCVSAVCCERRSDVAVHTCMSVLGVVLMRQGTKCHSGANRTTTIYFTCGSASVGLVSFCV